MVEFKAVGSAADVERGGDPQNNRRDHSEAGADGAEMRVQRVLVAAVLQRGGERREETSGSVPEISTQPRCHALHKHRPATGLL